MIERDSILTVRAATVKSAARFFAENYGVPESVNPTRVADEDANGLYLWSVPAIAAKNVTAPAA